MDKLKFTLEEHQAQVPCEHNTIQNHKEEAEKMLAFGCCQELCLASLLSLGG